MFESRSKSRCRTARCWLALRLTSEYHNQTGSSFTNTNNNCHRSKIYVLTSLLKHVYLQPALCARIYCAVNKVCHSCCHHRESTSHEQRCCYCGFEMLSQLLPLTLSERTSHRPSKQRRDMRLTSWLTSRLNRILYDFPLWIRLDLDPDRVSSETRSGSKQSLESSLESRLIIDMAPGPSAGRQAVLIL